MSASDGSEKALEVYVCNNIDCVNRGGAAVLGALQREFLDDRAPPVEVRTYNCFAACNSGPNVVIPSRRCWLSAVGPDDAAIVREVVGGTAPPARMREKNDPRVEEFIVGLIDAGFLREDVE